MFLRYNIRVKVRDIIKAVESAGWQFDRQSGSHRQFKHSTLKGVVTIAGKPGDDLDKGTELNIKRQAGLR